MSGSFNATADSSLVGIRLVQESSVGTTPASPQMKEIEITGESLNNQRTTVVSNSFRTDRQVPGATKVSESNSGDINFELKYGGVYDDLIEAALQGTWAENAVSNGVTRRAFTVEKMFNGISGERFEIYRGAEVSTFSLSMTNGALITGSFGLFARSFQDASATVSASLVAPPTTKFMNTVTQGFVIEANDVAVPGVLQSFEFTLDNNLREQRAIGSAALAGMGAGRSNLTGTVTAFFNGSTNAINTAYKNEQPVKLQFTVPDVDGNKYRFTFWNVVLLTRTRNAGGLDQDVVATFTFQATLGGPDSKTFTVERIPD